MNRPTTMLRALALLLGAYHVMLSMPLMLGNFPLGVFMAPKKFGPLLVWGLAFLISGSGLLWEWRTTKPSRWIWVIATTVSGLWTLTWFLGRSAVGYAVLPAYGTLFLLTAGGARSHWGRRIDGTNKGS